MARGTKFKKQKKIRTNKRIRDKCKAKKMYLTFDEAEKASHWQGMIAYECTVKRYGIPTHWHVGHIALHPMRHR